MKYLAHANQFDKIDSFDNKRVMKYNSTADVGKGNIIDIIGTALHLPEMGVSEFVAGGPTVNTAVFGKENATSNNTPVNQPLKSYNTYLDPNNYAKGTPKTTPTNNGGGGGGGGGGDVDKWNADWAKYHPTEGQRPEGYHGEGGGGNGVSDSDISDAYAPAISALEEYRKAVQGGADADISNLDTRVKEQSARLDTENQDLLNTTASEQSKFNDTLQTALQDAIRAYNALQQQGNARFGRGNSAGQAVGELAQQEFFRQQGGVNKQQVAGDLQFENERQKIMTFTRQKKSDLDMYKNEAVTAIKNNLSKALADISARRGDIEINKTKDRIAALQTAKQQAQNVYLADLQYRQSLITGTLNSMQQAAGRAFTPAEIAANLQELQNMFFGGDMSTTSNSGVSQVYKSVGGNKDDLSATNPIQGATI